LPKNGSFAKLGLWVGLCGFANVPFVRLVSLFLGLFVTFITVVVFLG
jgi:hypothetical protein